MIIFLAKTHNPPPLHSEWSLLNSLYPGKLIMPSGNPVFSHTSEKRTRHRFVPATTSFSASIFVNSELTLLYIIKISVCGEFCPFVCVAREMLWQLADDPLIGGTGAGKLRIKKIILTAFSFCLILYIMPMLFYFFQKPWASRISHLFPYCRI